MSTSTKKTLRVPVAADGVPLVVEPSAPERTREIRNDAVVAEVPADAAGGQAAPTITIAVDEDITVPVHSSIESSLTFEVLRRQSTDDDEGEKKR
jgi:hypothetical protein